MNFKEECKLAYKDFIKEQEQQHKDQVLQKKIELSQLILTTFGKTVEPYTIKYNYPFLRFKIGGIEMAYSLKSSSHFYLVFICSKCQANNLIRVDSKADIGYYMQSASEPKFISCKACSEKIQLLGG